ncbi:DUF3307 domain-containing protein [Liberiplasma polymorphum]|uniref:DUF3307 domain-containing protein n=1 Tax=Liberiplasma polymorphum TaxID=3374570 RepID=UPI003771764F
MIYLNVLLLLHVIGDFYTQSNRVNLLKKESFKGLFTHVFMYTMPFLIFLFFISPLEYALVLIGYIFLAHLIIDYFKIRLERHKNSTVQSFVIDQGFHIVVLIIAYFILRTYFVDTIRLETMLTENGVTVTLDYIVRVGLVFLIILKPVSYLIEMMLPKNKQFIPVEDANSSEPDYGDIIGKLERITILLFGLLNLYGSIALVITAKSIARFKQLEDKSFAQKYLIGTLLSLCITLILLLIFLG